MINWDPPAQPAATAPSVRLCDLTFQSPAENLACDEALLDQCDADPASPGVLRFWEPKQYFAVVGYANQAGTEVNLHFCRNHNIPVLRRCSGGGTVLQGPGCLNYSLILRLRAHPSLEGIHTTNEFILQHQARVLSAVLQAAVQRQGDTDLVIDGLKFAGNAQRRKRHALIFHGCLLLNLDIDLLEKALPMPSKQPGYRLNRSHRDFLVNLKADATKIKSAIADGWGASAPLEQIPRAATHKLAVEKYSQDEWNFKF